MKITDLIETKMPHLYLDMDGVQADFFGAWAKRHGLKHYKEIAHPEDAINELAQSGPEQVYQFFRDLEPLRGGQEIIQWLHKNKIPFTVLSAPLRGPYANNSIEAKKDWLDQHNPGTSNNAIFTSKKFKYAKNGNDVNVLVDDFGRYLDGWNNAGGIAVKHEDSNTQHTINELEKIYSPYLNR
jgi:hypothetical protein